MRRNRTKKQRRQRRKNKKRDIDSGDLLIEIPFFMHDGTEVEIAAAVMSG